MISGLSTVRINSSRVSEPGSKGQPSRGLEPLPMSVGRGHDSAIGADGKEPKVRIIVRALRGALPAEMATLRLLFKRFVAQRSLGLAVVVTLAFTIGVLVAGPIYADAAREAILSSSLANETVTVKNARVQTFGGGSFDWVAADEAIRGAFTTVPVDTIVAQGLGTVRLEGMDGPSVPLLFRDGAPDHLAIEGEAPGPGEIALPAGMAAASGVGPGARMISGLSTVRINSSRVSEPGSKGQPSRGLEPLR
jgi:hypothetical protein